MTECLNLAAANPAQAQAVQWKGNGHFYEVVAEPDGITWTQARAAAKARGGDLVSLTSKEENRFAWSFIAEKTQYWTKSLREGESDAVGPWIGLVQIRHQAMEPDKSWRWVSKEPLEYTKWAPGKPNNLQEIEDYAHYFIVACSPKKGTWNDISNDPLQLKGVQAQRLIAYIVEYNSDPSRQQNKVLTHTKLYFADISWLC